MCVRTHQCRADYLNLGSAQSLQMGLQTFLEQILFVIVLYKRRPEMAGSFQSLLEMKEHLPERSIFIYDNSPGDDPGTETSVVQDSRVTYTRSPENFGVSRAYNTAARLATSLDKKWLLLLDQDTRFEGIFLEKLLEATSFFPDVAAFAPIVRDAKGIVSPFVWSMGRGWRIKHCSERLSLEIYRFINSGLLIERAAFLKAGGYDEGAPLDFSDIAFGEKLRQVCSTFNVVESNLVTSFSGSSKLSTQDALARFRFFCQGGIRMSTAHGPRYLILFNMLARAVALSFGFRTLDFMRTLFSITTNPANGPSHSKAHHPSTMPYEP